MAELDASMASPTEAEELETSREQGRRRYAPPTLVRRGVLSDMVAVTVATGPGKVLLKAV